MTIESVTFMQAILSDQLLQPVLLNYLLLIVVGSAALYYFLLPANVIKDSSVPGRAKVRGAGQRPPAYPNGWIPVEESRNISSGRVTKGTVFVHEIVLFRDESGIVCAFDAYCPHLGAHFGYGGTIINRNGKACLRCPFHGWLFNSKGVGVEVPYAENKRAPSGIKIKKWDCVEWSGFVCVWYHAEGEKPTWWPMTVPEIVNGSWGYGGRTEDVINCHFQEIPENGADAHHLMSLHKSSVLIGKHFGSWTDWRITEWLAGCHEWTGVWNPSPAPDGHMADVGLFQKFFLFGCNLLTVDFEIKQIGPTLVVLIFSSKNFGGFRGAYVQAITPLDVNKQRIVHHVYIKQSPFGKLLSKFMLHGQSGMLERDILMWTHKKYLKTPVLVKEEKSLAKFRQWYSQFYSVNSPKRFETVDIEW